MVFVRESSHCRDPVLPYLYEGSFTWQSALIVTAAGDRIAIVGQFDDGAVRATGHWTEVIPYVQSIRDPLVEVLTKLNPRRLALNFSVDDFAADGLTHGMYSLLLQYLTGTPYAERIVSSVDVVGAFRGRKTASELSRIEAAIATAETILEAAGRFARPGKTERELAHFIQQAATQHGVGLAWESPCPIVNSGPDSMIGHGTPTDQRLEPGHILHIDFGVQQNGYCSDLQRCWYIPRPEETQPPAAVARAFDAVVTGITKAAERLQPGVEGWQVDAVAREVLAETGFPEYGHALGHHVGRNAHDGGGILGPRWDRYGRTPYRKVETGNVFTLEPSLVDAGGAGCLGIEEMVVVTETGCRWLSHRQMVLPLLGTA
ncbi:MAG: aminopeptidase P family protein [Planctomycetes bacterium]|nr:aminopeptidase P family protein [Planctomycetota bacterium]